MTMESSKEYEVDDFRNAYNDLDSMYAFFPRNCGLSWTEYWALLMVHEGAETQRDICERLSLSRQTVNSAFRQLVKKGLVRLTPVENNLRTKRVLLTEKGSDFVETYIVSRLNLEVRVWHMMEADERAQLVRLLRKYKDSMHEALQLHQETK